MAEENDAVEPADDGLAPDTAEYLKNREEPAEEAPETKAEDKVKEPEKKPKDTMVPHAALHEERERRKELAAELEKARELSRKMEERFQAWQDANKPKPPAFEEDPAAHLKAETEELKAWREEQRRAAEESRANQERRSQQERMMQTYHAYARDFAQRTPDFQESYKALAAWRDEELRVAGWDDPAERHQRLIADEMGIVAKAMRDGVNPAERIYALAKKVATPKPKDDNFEQIERGQKAARSLSNASGSTPAKTSLERLAAMSDEEFAEEMQKAGGYKKAFAGIA